MRLLGTSFVTALRPTIRALGVCSFFVIWLAFFLALPFKLRKGDEHDLRIIINLGWRAQTVQTARSHHWRWQDEVSAAAKQTAVAGLRLCREKSPETCQRFSSDTCSYEPGTVQVLSLKTERQNLYCNSRFDHLLSL